MNWILEQDVEHDLIPIDLHVIRQAWPGNMGVRLVVRREGFVGGERGANFKDLRIGQAGIILIDLDRICDPNHCRFAQGRVNPR